MSELSVFLKKNKQERKNAFFPATKNFVDKNGDPIMWEVRPLTTSENERIQAECTKEVPVPGKKGMFRSKTDTQMYLTKLMVAAIVFPDLYNKELQDSYGVMTPEDLLKELIDNPAEFNDFREFIVEQSGFDKDLNEEIEEAKN